MLGFVLVAATMVSGCTETQPPASVNARLEEHNVTIHRYVYEPGTNATLNVTLGDEVVLHLTSTDVTHGFAIQEYGINVEVPAGHSVDVRFKADKAGDFVIYCTVFCGSGHPQHKGTLHVA
jgi:heme/copper-type cytochrome/quinol oxidase subunit 2